MSDMAERIETIAGALRVMREELQPGEYAAHLYAQTHVDDALVFLGLAAGALRERETLEAANAFGGGTES